MLLDRLSAAARRRIEGLAAAPEVGAGTECLPGARDDDGPHGIVGIGALEGIDQLATHDPREGVQPVRSIEREGEDPVLDRIENLLVCHWALLRPQGRTTVPTIVVDENREGPFRKLALLLRKGDVDGAKQRRASGARRSARHMGNAWGSIIRAGAGAAIEGNVTLPAASAPPSAESTLAGQARRRVGPPDAPAAVVFVETTATPRAAGATRRAEMAQHHYQFAPGLLAIERGSMVTFPNLDDEYHSVFSYSQPKRFDLGRYRKDEQPAELVFDQPGLVKLFCEIHDHMRGWILVLDTPYFAKTSTDGRYRLDGVPAGHQVLKVWVDDRHGVGAAGRPRRRQHASRRFPMSLSRAALSFRWKLFLAMMLVVTGVAGAALLVTQQAVAATYAKIFRERFRAEADLFSAAQQARLAAIKDKCLELARSVRLVAALEERDAALLYQIAFDELREVMSPEAAPRPATFFR